DLGVRARNMGVVWVSKNHNPRRGAVGLAGATHPDVLEALTVAVDRDEVQDLKRQWDAAGFETPLKTLASPYREVTRPVLDYVRSIGRTSPRDVISVFIPEYVVGRWWENLLHNQSALWLKSRLLFAPGVMVTSVPWQLSSSERRPPRPSVRAPGSVRRGEPALTPWTTKDSRGPGMDSPPGPNPDVPPP
ncbi:DNA-binding protein, partial [Streptomyces inhibens]